MRARRACRAAGEAWSAKSLEDGDPSRCPVRKHLDHGGWPDPIAFRRVWHAEPDTSDNAEKIGFRKLGAPRAFERFGRGGACEMHETGSAAPHIWRQTRAECLRPFGFDLSANGALLARGVVAGSQTEA